MPDTNSIIRNIVSGLHARDTPVEKRESTFNTTVNNKDNVRRVALGSDHGGLDAKEILVSFLQGLSYHVTDVGTYSKESVDYPDFAVKVAKKVSSGDCDRGIMIDGAGIGSSMVCNKVKVYKDGDTFIVEFGDGVYSITLESDDDILYLQQPTQNK